MNYLVLTPDGVGSTYLQRALTVYLNSSGMEYYNTHELLNGLALDSNNNLHKSIMKFGRYSERVKLGIEENKVLVGYSQSTEEIVKLIEKNEGNIVSRIAQYHVEDRLAGEWPYWISDLSTKGNMALAERNKHEDYSIFYDTCRNNYDKIFYCTRDPFEYALSWGIRAITGMFNVYSLKERIETHGENITYDGVDLDYMTTKLDQYIRYIYWVKDNFKDAVEVKYDDLHTNVDLVLSNITGLDYRMLDTWDISLQDYSTLLYKMSMIYNPSLDYSDKLIEYQKTLVQQRKLFRSGMPIKMTTLRDKGKKVTNFVPCLETYNKWAKSSNEYSELSEEQILDKMQKEEQIYL